MGTIVAIDYGTKYLGFARSDELFLSAAPVGTVKIGRGNTPLRAAVRFVRKLAATQAVDLIVIGLPLGMHGKDTVISKQVESFAAELHAKLKIPVRLWDETYTSVQANVDNRFSGDVHSISAAIILSAYLETYAQSD